MIAVFNIIFILIGLAFLLPILAAAVAFLFKVSVGSVFVGFTFMTKSYEILSKKWWAWFIQLPILFFQVVAFIGTYMENQIGLGILLVVVFQLIASTIIFNIQRIIQKDY